MNFIQPCVLSAVRVISAAWYLRNCVKCTKVRNVSRLGWTCLSGIHHRALTLFSWNKIPICYSSKYSTQHLPEACWECRKSPGLDLYNFCLESWSCGTDAGTGGSIAFLWVLGATPGGGRKAEEEEQEGQWGAAVPGGFCARRVCSVRVSCWPCSILPCSSVCCWPR